MIVTSYDVEGTYTVEVTAIGDNYYNSETTIVEFVIAEEVVTPPVQPTSCNNVGLVIGISAGALAVAAAGVVFLVLKKGKKEHVVQ